MNRREFIEFTASAIAMSTCAGSFASENYGKIEWWESANLDYGRSCGIAAKFTGRDGIERTFGVVITMPLKDLEDKDRQFIRQQMFSQIESFL